MKKKILVIAVVLIALVFVIIFISGCIDNGGQQGESATEIMARQGDSVMVISPSDGKVINGVVTITMTKVPKGAEVVAFAISGPGIPSIEETGPNLGTDRDSSDGWSITLDTVAYQDNEYTIYGIPLRSTGGQPLGGAYATIEIKNAGKETKLEPPSGGIDFYKIVYLLPTDVTAKRIAEVKESGANVIGFHVMLDYENMVYSLPKGWDVYIKGHIREAYRNGLAVSLSIKYSGETISKDLPYREGSNIDLPPGYDLVAFRKNMKEIYGELAIFAQENKVHIITHPAEVEEWIGRVYLDSKEYWTQTNKLNQEIGAEIRKHFKGKVIGNIMGGTWGFGAPCCYTNVPVRIVDFSGFDGLIIGISGSTLGYVEEGLMRIEFTKNFISLAGGGKIICAVGAEGSPGEGKTQTYNEFFEKSRDLVDGYLTVFIPADVVNIFPYDRASIEVAKSWYKKLP